MFGDLFSVTSLTTAVNNLVPPPMTVYQRLFAKRAAGKITDQLAFDVISGSEKILKNLSVSAPAQVTDKTGRKTITITAPRLSPKRMITAAELNAHRQAGGYGLETLKDRTARELQDMRNEIDRTIEFWCVNALQGIIYDSDMVTELVNFNFATNFPTHIITLTGDDLWTAAASDPLAALRTWQDLVNADAGGIVREWVAFCGKAVMDAMIGHDNLRELLRYEKGAGIAEEGRVARLANVEFNEDNDRFTDPEGERHRYLATDTLILVGLSDDTLNLPYAPVVDLEAPGGVGNITENGKPAMYFAKSWDEKDPSALWIKAESRPLPVVQRPGAVIKVKAV